MGNTPYTPNGKKVYEDGLKIDGFKELVEAHPNSKKLLDGTAPYDFPDTKEKLLEKFDWVSEELAAKIEKAAGGEGVQFRLVADA